MQGSGNCNTCPQGIIIIEKEDQRYPEQLRLIPQPPERLYCIGDTELLKMPMAAVIGSRKCSEYGKKTAMAIGTSVGSAGAAVVSGMAKGIDSFGHLGALKAGGKTIAVLGCGADVCYPAENRKLYEQIASEGLVISEYPPGTPPMPFRFPLRNRIIAGLSSVVTVVEAGRDSGALITATLAAELGREVYAVPGNITSMWSLGTNKLIADGAMPVVTVDDVARAMGLDAGRDEEDYEGLSRLEQQVVKLVKSAGEVSLEYLCSRTGKSTVDMNGIVMVLEMKGYLATNFGKIFVAKF